MPDVPRARSLESLRKEAKRWLAAIRAGDPDARTRFSCALPDGPATPSLRDVQHALAIEQGDAGWAALRERLTAVGEAVTESVRHYERMADALLDAYRTGTPEAMERHWRLTWHRRAWSAMRTYVQIDLGKRAAPEVEITREDARWLVAREHGFDDWAALTRELAHERATVTCVERQLIRPMAILTSPGHESSASSRDWDALLEQLAEPGITGLHAHGSMTDALLREVVPLSHLTTLRLGGSASLTDDGIRLLARMPNLMHLDLSGTAITDAGLTALRDLPALRVLSLAGTHVTDAGVRASAPGDRLEEVDLAFTACGDGAISALARRPALRHVRTGNAVTDDGIAGFHEYPVFTRPATDAARTAEPDAESTPNSLFLRGTFTDRGVARLQGLHGLFALDLDDARLTITGRALEPLAGLEGLASLALDAGDDAMPIIARLPGLRFLRCQDTPASDSGWAALGASRTIERIWGRRCYGLANRGFAALSRMPRLTSLSVSCRSVDDATLALLPEFGALRELMPMDIPDGGYRHIGRCVALERLVLMYCRDTSDAATRHITRLPRLSSYFASYTRATDRTPRLLAGIDSLERVTLDTCAAITNDGVVALARLPKLRELRVSGRYITAGVAAAFRPGVTVHYSR